jgi:transposase-like protein
MGVTKDGKKELVAMADGVRESKISWKIILEGLKHRGLEIAPELAVGDGALGFWSALAEVFPTTNIQRCWVHKTANVLDKLPKSMQDDAKKMLHNIWMAPTREEANAMFEAFVETFEDKYPKAVDCLSKDRKELLAFNDFPAEHWRHIRTTNPIESSFATVRLRTYRQKGPGSARAGLAMAFKLLLCAEKKWKVINGVMRLSEVVQQVQFVDGIRKAA